MKNSLASCTFAALLAVAPISSSSIAADTSTVNVGSLKIENAFTRPTP
jgi:hypothetical protein